MILRATIVIVFLFNLFTSAKSQSESDSIFTFCDTMPEFPGGKQKMMNHVTSQIYFPVSCSKENINTKFTVSFVIDTMGKVTEVSFRENIVCKDFENVLKEIFYKMPTWQPGIHRGKKVKVKYTHPIYISIE